MASEAGVIELPPEKIRRKGRLRPGNMFIVDTVEGRIISDNEIKSKIARQKPYRRWLDENKIELRGFGVFHGFSERFFGPLAVCYVTEKGEEVRAAF